MLLSTLPCGSTFCFGDMLTAATKTTNTTTIPVISQAVRMHITSISLPTLDIVKAAVVSVPILLLAVHLGTAFLTRSGRAEAPHKKKKKNEPRPPHPELLRWQRPPTGAPADPRSGWGICYAGAGTPLQMTPQRLFWHRVAIRL